MHVSVAAFWVTHVTAVELHEVRKTSAAGNNRCWAGGHEVHAICGPLWYPGSMNLTLNLTPELEAKLREQARATGKPPEDLALEALQDKLAMAEDVSAMLPRSIWKQEFEALLESMPDGNVDADLSRASVYEGRGE